MNLEQVPEQLSLNFDSTPEDEYRDLSDAELIEKYAEKVRVPLKTSRYVLQDGTYDRENIIWAILNPDKERDLLLNEEREDDKEAKKKGGWWQ